MMFAGIVFTHTDLWIALAVLIVVPSFLYMRIKGIEFGGTLILDHWGDCIGLFLILLGVGIILIAPIYKNETNSVQVITTGSGLITAGFVALKLKTVPDSSANNGGTRITETHTAETVAVAPIKAEEPPPPPIPTPPKT